MTEHCDLPIDDPMSIEFMLDRLGGILDRLGSMLDCRRHASQTIGGYARSIGGYARSIGWDARSIEGYVGTIAIPRRKPTPVACTIQIDRQSTLLYVR
jgi:hypothetical protein